jgi:hypothetical protein
VDVGRPRPYGLSLRHMDTPDGQRAQGDRYQRPYAVPDKLDLQGPSLGTVGLPSYLNWSGNAVYDLDAPARGFLAAREPAAVWSLPMSEGCFSIGFMSHLPVTESSRSRRCRTVSPRRSVPRWRVLTRRLWRGLRPTGRQRLPARGMSTVCSLPDTSWSTGSTGSPLRAGRNLGLGSVPASESWPSRPIGRSDEKLPPKSARSSGRPRPSLHERLDVGVRPGCAQCRRRTHSGPDRPG